MSAELTAIDLNIRRYTNAENAHRDLAVHFAELAEEDHRSTAYWLEQRDLAIGALGVENVIPLPSGAEVGDIV